MFLMLLACVLTDEDVRMAFDPDGDGVGAPEDCAPLDATAYPGAEEIWYDGVAGAAYVVLSGGLLSAGKSSLNLRLADLKILGEQEGGAAGMSVSCAGDIDGDGRGDLLVGAPRMSAGGGTSGAAYLLLTSGALSSMSSTLSLSAADLILVGEDSDDQAGTPVSSAGDADGDGYSDVLVGVRAVRQEGGDARDDAGYLLLSSGVLSEVGPTLGLAAADVKFVGDEGENSGYSIASAGDVDADGHSDVLVGADYYGEWGSGASYLLTWAGELSSSGSTVALEESGFKVTGSEGDHLGASVASAGDVNGDGLDDLLVGAPSVDEETGAAYLFFHRYF
jgi:hypothetical protein